MLNKCDVLRKTCGISLKDKVQVSKCIPSFPVESHKIHQIFVEIYFLYIYINIVKQDVFSNIFLKKLLPFRIDK